MDHLEIREWRDFCEGNSPHTPDHFSGLFMELYLEPLTEEDKDNLQAVFSFVPNSRRALEKMLLLDAPARSKAEGEVIGLVLHDLSEMRRIIKSKELFVAMELGVTEITIDENRFQQVCGSSLNRQFFHELASYFAKEMRQHDSRIRALSNAFYGLANNVHLQWALTADLLQNDVDFDSYFELYRVGVDYALCDNGVVVMNYRAKNAALVQSGTIPTG